MPQPQPPLQELQKQESQQQQQQQQPATRSFADYLNDVVGEEEVHGLGDITNMSDELLLSTSTVTPPRPIRVNRMGIPPGGAPVPGGALPPSGSGDLGVIDPPDSNNTTTPVQKQEHHHHHQPHSSEVSEAWSDLEARSFVNGLLSPFSPLLKQRNSNKERRQELASYVSLQPCLKVSVVVRVMDTTSTPTTSPSRSSLDEDTDDTNNDNNNDKWSSPSTKSNQKTPKRRRQTNNNNFNDDDDDDSDIMDQLCVFPHIKQALPPGTTPPRTPTRIQGRGKSNQSPRDLIIVKPSAFGKFVPNHVTMETARLVAQVARISSEDWARLYEFHHVIWPLAALPAPAPPPPDSTTTTGKTNATTATTNTPTKDMIDNVQQVVDGDDEDDDFSSFEAIARAVAQDATVEHKSSVLISLGHGPSCIGQPNTLASQILSQMIPLLEDKAICRVSIMELDEEGNIRDLLASSSSSSKASKSNSSSSSTKMKNHPYLQIRHIDNKGAVVQGLVQVHLDSMPSLMQLLEGTKQQQQQQRRKHSSKKGKHKNGSVTTIATISVWSNAVQHELDKQPTCQVTCVELAPNHNQYYETSTTTTTPATPRTTAKTTATMTTTALQRQSVVNLGLALRQLLLQSAEQEMQQLQSVGGGMTHNNAKNNILSPKTVSFRETTLTKLLQRCLEDESSKIVVVASISPLSSQYESTLATLNYVRRLLVAPGRTASSPFRRSRTNNNNDTSSSLASASFANHNTMMTDQSFTTTNGTAINTPTTTPLGIGGRRRGGGGLDRLVVLETGDLGDGEFKEHYHDEGEEEEEELSSPSLLQGYGKNEVILKQIVADPRQRLAKIFQNQKSPTKAYAVGVNHLQTLTPRSSSQEKEDDNDDDDNYPVVDYMEDWDRRLQKLERDTNPPAAEVATVESEEEEEEEEMEPRSSPERPTQSIPSPSPPQLNDETPGLVATSTPQQRSPLRSRLFFDGDDDDNDNEDNGGDLGGHDPCQERTEPVDNPILQQEYTHPDDDPHHMAYEPEESNNDGHIESLDHAGDDRFLQEEEGGEQFDENYDYANEEDYANEDNYYDAADHRDEGQAGSWTDQPDDLIDGQEPPGVHAEDPASQHVTHDDDAVGAAQPHWLQEEGNPLDQEDKDGYYANRDDPVPVSIDEQDNVEEAGESDEKQFGQENQNLDKHRVLYNDYNTDDDGNDDMALEVDQDSPLKKYVGERYSSQEVEIPRSYDLETDDGGDDEDEEIEAQDLNGEYFYDDMEPNHPPIDSPFERAGDPLAEDFLGSQQDTGVAQPTEGSETDVIDDKDAKNTSSWMDWNSDDEDDDDLDLLPQTNYDLPEAPSRLFQENDPETDSQRGRSNPLSYSAPSKQSRAELDEDGATRQQTEQLRTERSFSSWTTHAYREEEHRIESGSSLRRQIFQQEEQRAFFPSPPPKENSANFDTTTNYDIPPENQKESVDRDRLRAPPTANYGTPALQAKSRIPRYRASSHRDQSPDEQFSRLAAPPSAQTVRTEMTDRQAAQSPSFSTPWTGRSSEEQHRGESRSPSRASTVRHSNASRPNNTDQAEPTGQSKNYYDGEEEDDGLFEENVPFDSKLADSTRAGDPTTQSNGNTSLVEGVGALEEYDDSYIAVLEGAVNQIKVIHTDLWRSSAMSLERLKDFQQSQREAISKALALRDDAKWEVNMLKEEQRKSSETHADELQRKDRQLQNLHDELDQALGDKGTVEKIADDAISAHDSLERKLRNLQEDFHSCQRQLESSRSDYKGLIESRDVLRKELLDTRVKLDRLEKEKKEGYTKISEQDFSMKRLAAEKSQLEEQRLVDKAKIEELLDKLKRQESSRTQLEDEKLRLEKLRRDDQSQMEGIEKQSRSFEMSLKKLEKERDRHKEMQREDNATIEKQQEELMRLRKTVKTLEVEQSRIDMLQKEVKRLEATLHEREQERTHLEQLMRDDKSDFEHLEQESKQVRVKLEGLEGEIEHLLELRKNDRVTIERLQHVVRDAETKDLEIKHMQEETILLKKENAEYETILERRRSEHVEVVKLKDEQMQRQKAEMEALKREVSSLRERERKQANAAGNEIRGLREELLKFQGDLSAAKRERDEALINLDSAEARQVSLSQQLLEKDVQIEGCQSDVDHLRDELTSLRGRERSISASAERDLRRLENQVLELQFELSTAKKKTDDATSQLEEESLASKSLSGDFERARTKLTRLNASMERLTRELQIATEDKRHAEEKLAHIRSNMEAYKSETQERVDRVLSHQREENREHRALAAANKELQSRVERLQRERDICYQSLELGRDRIAMISSKSVGRITADSTIGPVAEVNARMNGDRMSQSHAIPELYLTDHPMDGMMSLRAEEIAAYLAMSAKKSINESKEESSKLRSQFRRFEGDKEFEISSLKAQVQSLERELGREQSGRTAPKRRPRQNIDPDN